jgi:hypothetical protein
VDIIIDDSRDNIVQKQIKGIVNAIHVVTTKYQTTSLFQHLTDLISQKKSVMTTTLLNFQYNYYIILYDFESIYVQGQ